MTDVGLVLSYGWGQEFGILDMLKTTSSSCFFVL